ncbi:NFX1-type zinc finger-containing protein 1-like [Diadema setosum]|uniref:NFX1-type zinc finger-containing protein 1-like n=1 Tax=Diadema setosum TaxID=31175 RepID=UPI003B3ABBBD
MASPRNASHDRGRGGERIGRRQGGRVLEETERGRRRHPDPLWDTEVEQEGEDGSWRGASHSTSGRRGHGTRHDPSSTRSSGSHHHQHRNFLPISSKLLQKILQKDTSEAAVELSSLKGCVKAGFNQLTIDEERQRLMWRSLAYICGTIGADHTVTMLLTLVSDSKLLTLHLPTYLIRLRSFADEYVDEIQTLLTDVFIVFKTMLQSLPSRVTDIKVPFTLLVDAVEGFKEVSTDLFKHLESIKTDLSHQIDALEKEQDKRRQLDRALKNPPPDNFREQGIFPTAEELEAGYQPFLRPHIRKGIYADGYHYLDVQFRLLKEDFIYPLRMGFSEYFAFKREHPNKTPRIHDIRIYEDVRFVRPICDSSGVSHCISFKTLPGVRWETAKRLMFGSLVLLSSDDFQTFFFATVANGDVKELEAGLVAIRLVDQGDASRLLGRTFVMAESTVFFGAYYPVLQGLQRMQSTSLPLARYILGLRENADVPVYLRTKCDELPEHTAYKKMDISPLFNNRTSTRLKLGLQRDFEQEIEVTNDDAWPNGGDVKLDPSQLEAVKTALTNELSVIQGPPGTGKTYVGLKIVEILVRNRHLWCPQEDPGPILLVCYTNHALDQFLEGIVQFLQEGIVRVGGRSKSKELEKFNLHKLLRGSRRPDPDGNQENYIDRRIRHLRKEVHFAKHIVERTQARMAGAKAGIVNESELCHFMSWTHYYSLLRLCKLKTIESWMVEWLLCECQMYSDWMQGLETQEVNEEGEEVSKGTEETTEASNNSQDTEQAKEGDEEIAEEMTEASNNSLDTEQANEEEEKVAEDMTEAKNTDDGAIDIEQEGDFIEVERMMEEDFETEIADKKDDLPFLGLDLSQTNSQLKRYISQKLLRADRIESTAINEILDVWQMSPNQRWALYHEWLSEYIEDLRIRLPVYENKYKQLCLQLEEAKDIEKAQVLRDATIIGMTTTGAANKQQVLQRVGPKIVVVEEAAEVLEAHITTALHSSCQQLILIGDHQQLRPKPNVYMLAKKYHLDISLFERLINNGFPYTQLQLQHRMPPQIADVMRKHFYDVLDDNDSVKEFENIRGVTKNLFFIDHAQKQECNEDIQSHSNLHEAKFLVALCYYFIQQGYKTHQITILTPYTGQLPHFKQLMVRDKCQGVKVTSIDNYQGEENDIILVSFVRSNHDGKIGFLRISNRLCVSLSRAKKGMFCIGNFTMFAEHNDLWKEIVEDLKKTNSIGESLQLQCANHPDQEIAVKTAEDFERVPNGSCTQPCEARLECGHVCRQLCHLTDREHVLYKCEAQCFKTICSNNHTCPNVCYKPCATSCSVIIEKLLPCLHSCQAPCGRNISDIKCNEPVEKTLQCSHKRILPCHESPVYLHPSCEIVVTRRLGCGHKKRGKCCQQGECEEIVEKTLDCGHTCYVECHKDPSKIKCSQEIERMLPCGHKQMFPCHKDINSVVCEVLTKKILSCGHKMEAKCCDKSECQQLVLKILPCGHSEMVKCFKDPKKVLCTSECRKLLACGHKCRGKCGKPCTEECGEMITRDDWPCKHRVTVKCSDKPSACYVKCDVTLLCGHSCKGTCGECDRGRFHLPCTEHCKKMLICGHKCTHKCGTPCSSCQQRCPQKCRHGQCRHPCSVPCELCLKRCKWNCPHFICSKLCFEPCDRPPCDEPCPKKRKKCGHPCIGLCGEICPTPCRVCDKTELEQRFFGTEDPSVSRYIQLEDCGHVFEVKELDKKLGYQTENTATALTQFKKILVPACPRCGKLIRVSWRYGSLLHTYQKSLRCAAEKSQEELKNQVAQTSTEIDSLTCQPLTIREGRHLHGLTKKSSLLLGWAKGLQHVTSDHSKGAMSHLSDHSKGICLRVNMISRVQSCSGSCIRKFRDYMACKEVKDVETVGMLVETLQTSVDEVEDFLTRDTVELTEQEIHDTETELKRQIMLKEFLLLLIEEMKDTSEMEKLVSILTSATRLGNKQWRSADELLTKLYRRNGFVRSENRSLGDLPEQVSSHLDAWRQCPVGHALRSSECDSNICPACDDERNESERKRRQEMQQERGRGRGRRRGRGRGRGRIQNRRR